MERRTFVKLGGTAVAATSLGLMAGCVGSLSGPGASDKHQGHHGEGYPRYQSPMNMVKRVDESPDDDEALAKFVVVSDTHFQYEYAPYEERAHNMFEDIKDFCPDYDAVVINGDITDHGRMSEFQGFGEAAQAAGFSYPDDFVLVIGNHDQYDNTEGAQPISNLTDNFRSQAGLQDQVHPYYDRTICGVHLIMLGPDRYPEDNWAHFGISDRQVEWMDSLVQADKEAGVLSLVFLHEPLYQTVRCTEPGDFGHSWSLSDEDNRNLHDHVRTHDNLVFFSGHTHALPDTVQLPMDAPLYVGTGSIAYCVDDPDDDDSGYADMSTYGSMGWEVTIWSDYIRFRLRDFLNHRFRDDLGTAIYRLA